jgi:hypothetical protein
MEQAGPVMGWLIGRSRFDPGLKGGARIAPPFSIYPGCPTSDLRHLFFFYHSELLQQVEVIDDLEYLDHFTIGQL